MAQPVQPPALPVAETRQAQALPALMPLLPAFVESSGEASVESGTFVLAAASRPALIPSPPAAPATAAPAERIADDSAAVPASHASQNPPADSGIEDGFERFRWAADLLLEVNATRGVPRSPYGELIYDVAVRHSLNPHLIAAVIHVESAFNPRAVSRKGACGLMQLLPDTARRFGLRKKKDLFNPAKNLEAGVRYLKWLTRRFSGDVHKILAAYNAGEGAVERFGGIPPYRETQQYVRKVFHLLNFEADSPAGPGPAVAEGGGIVAAGK